MQKQNTVQLIVSADEAIKVGDVVLNGHVKAILDAGTELDSGRK